MPALPSACLPLLSHPWCPQSFIHLLVPTPATFLDFTLHLSLAVLVLQPPLGMYLTVAVMVAFPFFFAVSLTDVFFLLLIATTLLLLATASAGEDTANVKTHKTNAMTNAMPFCFFRHNLIQWLHLQLHII